MLFIQEIVLSKSLKIKYLVNAIIGYFILNKKDNNNSKWMIFYK